MSSAIASVETLPKEDPIAINPRATQYGLLPIWAHPVHAKDFAVWEFPVNKFFPFRPFQGETVIGADGKVLGTVERMPMEQVEDMQRGTRAFIHLPELALLKEEKAYEIAAMLAPQRECPKYAYDLKTGCVTCWLAYLEGEAPQQIESLRNVKPKEGDKPENPEEVYRIARETLEALKKGFHEVLREARRRVQTAVQEIEKKKKEEFSPAEMLAVYHTHSERPVYRTSVSGGDIGQEIANAIRGLQQPAQVDPAAIEALIERAVQERLAAAEKEPKENFGEKMKRIAAEKKAAVEEEE